MKLLHFRFLIVVAFALIVSEENQAIAQQTYVIGHDVDISYCPASGTIHADCLDKFESGEDFEGILEADCSIARQDSSGILTYVRRFTDTIAQLFSAPYERPIRVNYDFTVSGDYCAVNAGAWYWPNQTQTTLVQITGDPAVSACGSFTASTPSIEP